MYKVTFDDAPEKRAHLAQYDWQFRTECGRVMPLHYLINAPEWDGNTDNVCAICVRRISK